MGGAPASHQEPGLPLPPPKRCLPQLEWVPTGSGFALPHPGASDDVWICFWFHWMGRREDATGF